MEIWITILTTIACVSTYILFLILESNADSKTEETIITIISIIVFVVIVTISILVINTSVKPIDVYRNKTELKITTINGEPIDSVVVHKK